jgi:hypothetical protein
VASVFDEQEARAATATRAKNTFFILFIIVFIFICRKYKNFLS